MEQFGNWKNWHLYNKTLLSIDVKRLIINIPIDFTTKLNINQLFPDEQSEIIGLSKKHFQKLLNWTRKKQPYNLMESTSTN